MDMAEQDMKNLALQMGVSVSQLPFAKPKNEMEAYKILISIRNTPFGADFNDVVSSLCYQFKHESNHVIFPENKEVVDTLINTTITGNANLSALKFPYPSFAFMMPEGYKTPSGRPLKSFVINIGTHRELSELLYRKNEQLGLGYRPVRTDSENDDRMQISATFYCGDMQFASTSAYMDDILSLFRDNKDKKIDLQDATDKITYENHSIRQSFEGQDEDGLATFDQIKIAIALAIHKNVFGDQVWVDEMPRSKSIKGTFTDSKHTHVHGFKVPLRKHSKPGSTSSRGSSSAHYRSNHFRNLKNPKYYQGKYATLPPESRWVSVEESWVGYEIQPHTVKQK